MRKALTSCHDIPAPLANKQPSIIQGGAPRLHFGGSIDSVCASRLLPWAAGCLTRLVGRALPNAAAMHSLHSHTIRSVQDNGIKWPCETRTRTRLHSCLRISSPYTISTHMNLVHVSVGSTYILLLLLLLLSPAQYRVSW